MNCAPLSDSGAFFFKLNAVIPLWPGVGYQISEKQVISDDEVRLLVLVQPHPGHPNVGNDLQVMQKVGDAWKYAGKWGVDIKEN